MDALVPGVQRLPRPARPEDGAEGRGQTDAGRARVLALAVLDGAEAGSGRHSMIALHQKFFQLAQQFF